MSAAEVDVAATTAAAPPVADANGTEPSQSAESAPAVSNADEETTGVLTPVQKRIDELTRRRYDAERRAEQLASDRDEWRDRAMQFQKPPPVEEPPAAAGKTLADFGYDETKYQDHLFKAAEARAVQAAQRVIQGQQQQSSAAERDAQFNDREQEYSKDLPDYFEVTRGNVPVTAEMADAIKASDVGPALAYHLGKNPQIAAKIARLPPLLGAMEMGRIAAKLSEKPKPPQVSAAPPPAPKIAGGDARVEKDPKDMTDAEFAKWRKKFQ